MVMKFSEGKYSLLEKGHHRKVIQLSKEWVLTIIYLPLSFMLRREEKASKN